MPVLSDLGSGARSANSPWAQRLCPRPLRSGAITAALLSSLIFIFLAPIASAQVPTPPKDGAVQDNVRKQVEDLKATMAAGQSRPDSSVGSTMQEASKRLQEAKSEAESSKETRELVHGKIAEALAARKQQEGSSETMASGTPQPTVDPATMMSVDRANVNSAYNFSPFAAKYYSPLNKLSEAQGGSYKHLRGKLGGKVVKIPSRDEIRAYEATLPKPAGPSTRMVGFRSFDDAPGVQFKLKRSATPSIVNAKNLPECSGGRIEERPSGYQGDRAKDLMMDVMHIRASDRAYTPDDGFGQQAEVFEYTPGAPRFEVYRDISFGLHCLPWRMRVTKEKVTIYEGREALKHYD